MRLIYYYVCFLLVQACTIKTTEYSYPIALSKNGRAILYIHQHSSTSIELVEWDSITGYTEQALWSLFNPAGVQLLPNDAGFSFIDNGRLRIKSFKKRMPKAIDFDEPLYNINSLQWIDEQSCYCSAQQGDRFSIFQLRTDGLVKSIVALKDKDCIYPKKVASHLFYIQRYQNNDQRGCYYSIMQAEYPNNGDESDTFSSQIVIDFQNSPIMFLAMKSENEGFVIAYPCNMDKDDSIITFFYYHIVNKNGLWEKNTLFSFAIPTYLLVSTSEARLFESILPLIPKVIEDKIYFSDCSHNKNDNLELYCYDLLTKNNQKIAIAEKQGHYFVPIQYGLQLCCGGTNLTDKDPFVFF